MPRRTCAHCGKFKKLHARGLCQHDYYLHRDLYPRTKLARPYTARERELLRRDWGKRTPQALAAELGRDVRSVYDAARRFRITSHPPVFRTTPGQRDYILRLHATGLSDREIGAVVGRSHVTVARWLRRAGKPSNCRASNRDRFPERTRQKQRQAKLMRIKRDGLEEAVGFARARVAARAQAVRMGWPKANTLLEAKILDFLSRHGPSTVVTIFAAIGRGTHWSRLTTRGLRNRGLLVNRGRAGKYVLYGLADGVERNWAFRDPRGRQEAESA